MKEFLIEAMKLGYKYEFQYYDYKVNEWTVPVLLTDARISRLLADKSISKIRIIIEP